MKKDLTSSIIVITVIFLFFACSKNNDSHSEPPSKETLLIEKQWKLVGRGYDFSGNDALDNSENFLRECETDDRYEFHLAGDFLIRTNTMKCDVTEQDVYSVAWKFENNYTEFDYGASIFNIRKLDKDSFILYQPSVAYFYRFAH